MGIASCHSYDGRFRYGKYPVYGPDAVSTLYNKISGGEVRTIITDVTMAASGIRKGALQRLGVEVKCYLQDERVAEMASSKGITRTQAGIRRAVEEHPDAVCLRECPDRPYGIMRLDT